MHLKDNMGIPKGICLYVVTMGGSSPPKREHFYSSMTHQCTLQLCTREENTIFQDFGASTGTYILYQMLVKSPDVLLLE